MRFTSKVGSHIVRILYKRGNNYEIHFLHYTQPVCFGKLQNQ